MSVVDDAAAELDRRLGGPPRLTFPEGWTLSGSWRRAQAAPGSVTPAESPAEQHVLLGYEHQGDPMTPAERAIWRAVDVHGVGVREYQRRQGWSSPGTAGNLLARARAKRGDDSITYHRILFAIKDGAVVAECPCDGWHYRAFCAHVARAWWEWAGLGDLAVTDLDSGDVYHDPPQWIEVQEER